MVKSPIFLFKFENVSHRSIRNFQKIYQNYVLQATLERLLSPNEILSHEAVLQELLDEHATSLPFRIIHRILDSWDWLYDNLTKDEILPMLSLIGALSFVVIMSQCLQYAVAFADDDENSYIRPQQKPVPELKLIEFKAETYNYLLGSILPGIN